MITLKERFYRDRERLFENLTDFCQQTLEKACVNKGQASFMVSGGSTPAPLYQRLSRRVLSWQRVNVALVDERWGDSKSASSNQAFIQKTLLQHNASDCQFTGLDHHQSSYLSGAEQANNDYQDLPNPWNLTILGMGNDGHTASIFPDATGTEQALDDSQDKLVTAIKAKPSKVTGENIERVTLSKNGILKSEQIVLLITGHEKLKTYRKALQETDHNKMPVSALLQQTKVPIQVFWAP